MKEDNHANVSFRLKIHQIASEKNEWEERCEVEAMTVDMLQEHLTSLELDYQRIARETDDKIQCLQKEKHEVHKNWHKAKKSMEVDKLEISNLKKNNLFLKSNHQCQINELQEELDASKKEIENQKKAFKTKEQEIIAELQTMKSQHIELCKKHKELENNCNCTKAWNDAYMKECEIKMRIKKEKEKAGKMKEKKEINRNRTRYKR